jgi:hypothetical protein
VDVLGVVKSNGGAAWHIAQCATHFPFVLASWGALDRPGDALGKGASCCRPSVTRPRAHAVHTRAPSSKHTAQLLGPLIHSFNRLLIDQSTDIERPCPNGGKTKRMQIAPNNNKQQNKKHKTQNTTLLAPTVPNPKPFRPKGAAERPSRSPRVWVFRTHCVGSFASIQLHTTFGFILFYGNCATSGPPRAGGQANGGTLGTGPVLAHRYAPEFCDSVSPLFFFLFILAILSGRTDGPKRALSNRYF